MKRREKEENDRAAAEAAKDLFDDFGGDSGAASVESNVDSGQVSVTADEEAPTMKNSQNF